MYFFGGKFIIITYLKVETRSIDQLDTKYKALKKQARSIAASVKRDIVKTGNKPLEASTLEALQGNDALLSLRARMGATASGFTSKHCMHTIFQFI